MFAFLDFEASSLGKRSHPIEVAWVFEDGRSEAYLIKPAPGWTEWDPAAEAIHHIGRELLAQEGTPHDVVARRMVEALAGHDILASAPSWDGKWLSTLLRGAGLPRHALRLRRTDDAIAESAAMVLSATISADRLRDAAADLIQRVRRLETPPDHRALADARGERERWLQVKKAAQAEVARRRD